MVDVEPSNEAEATKELAPRLEIFSWAMFDFANSGYSTVVATAVFNAYFVNVIAGGPGGYPSGTATLLWTVAIAISYALVVLSAPVLGSIADFSGAKKRLLIITTVGCTFFTALLSFAGPGAVVMAMILVVAANTLYATGENLIAAFLPEISPKDSMGRISALGWTLGYTGGLLIMGVCLAYIKWAESQGQVSQQYVPPVMIFVSVVFLLAAMPCFLWLKERTKAKQLPPGQNYIQIGFARLSQTVAQASRFQDLFRFLITLVLYSCGTSTVIVLASVYAQEVMGFTVSDTVAMVMIVNITAAVGAFVFGFIQDKLGSVPTLRITLALWVLATLVAYLAHTQILFWVAANLIGIAMGSSQSAGRALVGLFSPPGRSAEFFGLWGLAVKLASIIGPMSYGLITYATGGNQRLAILSTVTFFVLGLAFLSTVNERRGKEAALTAQ